MFNYSYKKFVDGMRSFLVSLTLVFSMFVTPAMAYQHEPQGPPDPFPGGKGGQQAIDALGDRLPEVAAAYGMTADHLRDLFLQDHTLQVSNGSELLYIDDPFSGDAEASASEQSSPAAAPFPTDQTFQLHSLPGANHTNN